MEKVRVGSPENYEAITITITKEKYPRLFNAKVREFMLECGMTYSGACEVVEGMEIELELLYSVTDGLFGVESDAVETCATSLYNPYTGENLLDWDENEETKYKYLGSYKGIDAVKRNNLTPMKIVNDMKEGKGNFITDNTNTFFSAIELEQKYSRYTHDLKYCVTYDVADRFSEMPIELIGDNAQDEYIDIFVKEG